jgi:aminocarboxymuconate-semialdehyde decarboxylase
MLTKRKQEVIHMKLIDVHSHIAPEGYLDRLARYAEGGKEPEIVRKDGMTIKLYDNGKYQLPINEKMFSAETIIAQMDKIGVQMNLISGVPDSGVLPVDHQFQASIDLNDCVAEIVKAYPGRFRGIGVLPWAHPDDAAKEAARVKKMGFVCVMLYSHSGLLLVDDKLMDPTYQVCQDLGLPLYLHPDIPLWYGFINNYNMVSNVGLVLDNSLSLLRLFKSGVLDRFPKLKLIMPHAGGVLPYLDGRLSYTPNAFRRFAPENQKVLSEYMRSENVWYDLANPSIPVLNMAREYLGTERLMFGSDYPFTDQDVLLDMLGKSHFTANELEGVFWKNAEALFGKLL